MAAVIIDRLASAVVQLRKKANEYASQISKIITLTDSGGVISVDVTEKPVESPRAGCYEFVFRDNGIECPTRS